MAVRKRWKSNRLPHWSESFCLCACLCRESIRKWEKALYLVNIVLVRTVCYSAHFQPPAFDKSDPNGKKTKAATGPRITNKIESRKIEVKGLKELKRICFTSFIRLIRSFVYVHRISINWWQQTKSWRISYLKLFPMVAFKFYDIIALLDIRRVHFLLDMKSLLLSETENLFFFSSTKFILMLSRQWFRACYSRIWRILIVFVYWGTGKYLVVHIMWFLRLWIHSVTGDKSPDIGIETRQFCIT